MKIPRPDENTKKFFNSVLPSDPRIKVRPMFGNVSAFVNGNMFMGLFGNDLFLRLSDKDNHELLENGGVVLEPMKGKPMKDYTLIPRTWSTEPDKVRLWISKSLAWASKLPERKKSNS